MRYSIVQIPVDNFPVAEVNARITDWAMGDSQHQVVTLNPEFVVAAGGNEEFKNVLQRASLVTCDGVGLSVACRLLHRQWLPRVTGVAITQQLLQAPGDTVKLFLLGGGIGVVEKVKHHYPQAPIVGEASGGALDVKTWQLADNEQIIEMITASGANVLLVGLGQVKQEMWIDQNLRHLPGVKVAIGIGGTFDYLSGTVKRAPAVMRRLGLEWLFRLVRQPRRLPRIINAVVIFPWLVAKELIEQQVRRRR